MDVYRHLNGKRSWPTWRQTMTQTGIETNMITYRMRTVITDYKTIITSMSLPLIFFLLLFFFFYLIMTENVHYVALSRFIVYNQLYITNNWCVNVTQKNDTNRPKKYIYKNQSTLIVHVYRIFICVCTIIPTSIIV